MVRERIRIPAFVLATVALAFAFASISAAQTLPELFGKVKNPKGFVVITDGQAWSGDVAIALLTARQKRIPVNVVGVGTIGLH